MRGAWPVVKQLLYVGGEMEQAFITFERRPTAFTLLALLAPALSSLAVVFCALLIVFIIFTLVAATVDRITQKGGATRPP